MTLYEILMANLGLLLFEAFVFGAIAAILTIMAINKYKERKAAADEYDKPPVHRKAFNQANLVGWKGVQHSVIVKEAKQ